MPFPVVKLGYLVIKQVSKPIARMLKEKAKTSPFLRNYILLPPAQWYHRVETTFRLRLMGFTKSKDVKPMSEEMAIELASDMLGELFIFSIGTGLIYAEYVRSQRKDQSKEDVQNTKLVELDQKVTEMALQLETQNTQIRELNRLLASQQTPIPQSFIDSKTGRRLEVQQAA